MASLFIIEKTFYFFIVAFAPKAVQKSAEKSN